MKTSPSEEDIHDFVFLILETLEADQSETDLCTQLRQIHARLNADQDLYLAVWEKLDAGPRREFKFLVELRECGEGSVFPPRYRQEVWESQGPCGVYRSEPSQD